MSPKAVNIVKIPKGYQTSSAFLLSSIKASVEALFQFVVSIGMLVPGWVT